jgi:leader peptidase (prepilin peptidase) / N-methyltransferase
VLRTGERSVAEMHLLALAASVFGLAVGSFLNVCIYRFPRKLSVVTPRSFCPECKEQISWRHNIPIISYFLLRGRCGRCRAAIPWRYPFVELATALLFYAVVQRWGLTAEGLKWLVFACLVLVLFWTDAETKLLPDVLTIGGLLVGLFFAAIVPLRSSLDWWMSERLRGPAESAVTAMISAALLALPFLLFSELYARIRGILPAGWGDTKLLGMLGAFLGPERGVLTLLIGSVSGAVIGLGYIWGTGKNPKTDPIPYGPFLCGASLVVVFWGPKFFAA